MSFNAEQEIQALKENVKQIQGRLRAQEKLLETIASPPWKRAWFFLQGYRLWKVGRWYKKTPELH